ncbi:hypothetical protein D3C73_1050870 [compost metagenome]
MGRLARDAAHNMDTELQSQTVDIIGQRLKALSVRRRRETVRGRQQPGVFIHHERNERTVLG